MDPNATLTEIRELIEKIDQFGEDSDTGITAALNLVSHVAGLDEWLSKGGAKPKAWITRP